MGGKSELDNALNLLNDAKLERFTKEQNCEWHFNPPHALHFGGVWERQIGTIRRVLDGMMMELGRSQLTHELLVTLMAEVSAIVNARPLATVPSDAEEPQPLSPAMLLCMKTRPVAPASGSSYQPISIHAAAGDEFSILRTSSGYVGDVNIFIRSSPDENGTAPNRTLMSAM